MWLYEKKNINDLKKSLKRIGKKYFLRQHNSKRYLGGLT